MYPNQPNQSGNGYPPYPANGQPQQPYGQNSVLPPLTNTGASGHNPYEFIMNPQKKRRGLGLSGPGGSKNMIIVLCVAVLLLVVVGATLMSALKPKGNAADLIAIAQRQQEIVRIATEATKQVTTANASNFVTTTELTVTSSQTSLITYLQSHDGIKLKGKTLDLDASTKTDTLLSDAASANNYDTVVVQVLSSELDSYQALLQQTYKLTTSKSGKALLQQTFTATADLQSQAKTLSGGS
jgi:hypothetical protein